MATKKKRRPATRRRTRSMSASAPNRKRRTYSRRAPARRRKRTMGDSGVGGKMTVMKVGKNILGGIVGGAIYTGPKFFFKMSPLVKAGVAAGLAVGAYYMKSPNVGSGIVGAATGDILSAMFATNLKDDLEDTEYVDPALLSDTGYRDEDGNAVVMDDDGTVYALNDDGDYQAIGDASDFNLNDDEEMNDAYALSNANGYALQDGGLPDVSMINLQDSSYC